jgi:hypothetical protein
MKPARTLPPTPCDTDLEREIIALLVAFSATIPSPRAPQII